MGKTKIVIVEDNVQLAEAFRVLLNNSHPFEVLNCFTDFNDLWTNIKTLLPEIILMDINLSGEINGVEATYRIKSEFPTIKIVVISATVDTENVLDAIKAGADGYISKISSYIEIINALNAVDNGYAAITPDVAKNILGFFRLNRNSPLTRRETEILQQVANGYNSVIVAKELFVSPETIKSHLRNIYIKLGANDRSEAIMIARKKKYII